MSADREEKLIINSIYRRVVGHFVFGSDKSGRGERFLHKTVRLLIADFPSFSYARVPPQATQLAVLKRQNSIAAVLLEDLKVTLPCTMRFHPCPPPQHVQHTTNRDKYR